MTAAAPKTPLLTVDLVLFHGDSRGDAVLLVRRRHAPFAGRYAFPGGFVEIGETVEDACRREAREETGLEVTDLHLVGVYSDPRRDPRGHVVSVAFLGSAALDTLCAGSDATAAELVADWRDQELAFDHGRIVRDAWRVYRSRCGETEAHVADRSRASAEDKDGETVSPPLPGKEDRRTGEAS